MEFSKSLYLINILVVAFTLVLYFIAREKNIKFSILWLSIFSLLSSILYLVMDAPDVAMTEAALGSCITTVIFLRIAKLYDGIVQESSALTKLWGVSISALFGAVLVYAGQDLASYGAYDTPLQSGIQEYYNSNTYEDIGIVSFVGAILASYRGYDTLGETSVIFIAGLCVVIIMKVRNYGIRS